MLKIHGIGLTDSTEYAHMKPNSDSDVFWKEDYIIISKFILYFVLIYLLTHHLFT